MARRKGGEKTGYPGVWRVGPGLYRVRAKVTNPRTGRVKEIDQHVRAASAREANEERDRLRAQAKEAARPKPRRVRLADYVTSWLARRAPRLKASTAERYATCCDLYILPHLGDLYVDAITAQDLGDWWANAQRSGRAPASLNGELKVLRAIFVDATDELVLARNPARRLRTLPEDGYTEDEPNRLTAEQLAAVLKALREEASPATYAMLLVLATTGARFGEVAALRWEDIDTEAGLIRIRRAVYKGHVDTTKTRKHRSVPLLPAVAEVLQEHRTSLLRRQGPGVGEGWCFPVEWLSKRRGPTFGAAPLRSSGALRKVLRAGLKTAGIPHRVSIHGLRRTFNNLVRQVATGEVVRSLTGHVSERMTEHYSHVERDEKQAAVVVIRELVRED